MRKIKLTLEYDGTRYAGWQIQRNSETIQERVEKALERVLREKIRVHGAGRTDAGVHALGQVAHFRTRSSLPVENIQNGANTYLPPDIAILQAEEVDLEFHARYSARVKIYRYLVYRRKVLSPFWLYRAYHFSIPLNVGKMRQAAYHLKGKQNFKAFAASGSSVRDTIRTISRLSISMEGDLLVFELKADGFLYKMVRNMVGTLLEVGRGAIAPGQVKNILQSGNRKLAGPTAPASGLYLIKVIY